jgi:DNA-binding NarL/FixJ family response regulator
MIRRVEMKPADAAELFYGFPHAARRTGIAAIRSPMIPRLLFVDDDSRLLRGIQRALSFKGDEWEMLFATDGREGLALMERMTIDVVVSDLRMPGMNGVEFLTQVKLRYPQIARLVLSGESDESLSAASRRVAQQYLFKPCDPDLLISTLDSVLQKRLLVQGVCEMMSG